MRFVPRMWIEWARFVRRPRLPERREAFGWTALGEVGQLLGLTVAIDFALVLLLGWLSSKLGVKAPEFEQLKQFGAVGMLMLGSLGIPILEETVFRGWLTGRRRMLVFVAAIIGVALSLAAARLMLGPAPYKVMAVLLLAWLVIGSLLIWRGGGPTPLWFARAFPILYVASALLFGLAHISNYDMSRPLLLLPFVVPQTIAGLTFGFARVRYGMWANVALHALSNALFLGLSRAGV